MMAGPSITAPGLSAVRRKNRDTGFFARAEISGAGFVRRRPLFSRGKFVDLRFGNGSDRSDLKVHDLDCLGLRHVAVAPLVRVVEALRECGKIGVALQRRDRNTDFVGLAAVAHAGAAQCRKPLARELLLQQFGECGLLHRRKGLFKLLGLRRIEPGDTCKTPGLMHVGDQHAEGRKSPGIARHQNAADAKLADEAPGNRRSHAAEGDQRELARIVAALDGDGAHRHRDICSQHCEDAPGCFNRRKPKLPRDTCVYGLVRLCLRNRHGAFE